MESEDGAILDTPDVAMRSSSDVSARTENSEVPAKRRADDQNVEKGNAMQRMSNLRL